MSECKQCQVFHDKWLSEEKLATEAIHVLWLFDTHPRVQEFLKSHGLWQASETNELSTIPQQAQHKIMPTDYERCPHCRGSFSFQKPNKKFICPWCNNDVRL